eukprot:6214785-Pleurochrysis_carterae.AAC.3
MHQWRGPPLRRLQSAAARGTPQVPRVTCGSRSAVRRQWGRRCLDERHEHGGSPKHVKPVRELAHNHGGGKAVAKLHNSRGPLIIKGRSQHSEELVAPTARASRATGLQRPEGGRESGRWQRGRSAPR